MSKGYTLGNDELYIISGYFNTSNNKFYSDKNYTTEITGEDQHLYISLTDSTLGNVYKYDGTSSSFVMETRSEKRRYSTIVKVICTGDIEDSIFLYDTNYYTGSTIGQMKLVNYKGQEGNWTWDSNTHDYIQS